MKRPLAIAVFIGIALFAFLIAPIIAFNTTRANITARNLGGIHAVSSRSVRAPKDAGTKSSIHTAAPAGADKTALCLQTAVNARESALLKALGKSHSSALLAYATRKAAFDKAWPTPNTDVRRKAVMTAWIAFNAEKQAAQEAWRNDIVDAWVAFVEAAQICGVPDADDKGILMDR